MQFLQGAASLGAVLNLDQRFPSCVAPTGDRRACAHRPGRSCWLLPRGRPAAGADHQRPARRPMTSLDHVIDRVLLLLSVLYSLNTPHTYCQLIVHSVVRLTSVRACIGNYCHGARFFRRGQSNFRQSQKRPAAAMDASRNLVQFVFGDNGACCLRDCGCSKIRWCGCVSTRMTRRVEYHHSNPQIDAIFSALSRGLQVFAVQWGRVST